MKINEEEKQRIQDGIVEMLKTVFDPEMPVDIYNLGLVYRIDVDDEANVDIDMTLTAPTCPIADFIVEDARQKVASVDGVQDVKVNLVWEPQWETDMMSDEAKLDLGML